MTIYVKLSIYYGTLKLDESRSRSATILDDKTIEFYSVYVNKATLDTQILSVCYGCRMKDHNCPKF